jgi:hypothetical protein
VSTTETGSFAREHRANLRMSARHQLYSFNRSAHCTKLVTSARILAVSHSQLPTSMRGRTGAHRLKRLARHVNSLNIRSSTPKCANMRRVIQARSRCLRNMLSPMLRVCVRRNLVAPMRKSTRCAHILAICSIRATQHMGEWVHICRRTTSQV